jgi:hypothetical protein
MFMTDLTQNNSSIRHDGDVLESLLLESCPDSTDDIPAKVGDVQWRHVILEAKNGSMNQTRPYKYNVMVTTDKREPGKVFIIPPNEIVRRVVKDNLKGQHVSVSLWCVSLKLNKDWRARFGVDAGDDSAIQEAILEAYTLGQNDPAALLIAKGAEAKLREAEQWQQSLINQL